MTSIDSVTRQLSSLDIAKPSTKLLTKYAAPNPFSKQKQKPLPSNLSTLLDIGKYDGGLERDLKSRQPLQINEEAADDLALDSSVSKYNTSFSFCFSN